MSKLTGKQFWFIPRTDEATWVAQGWTAIPTVLSFKHKTPDWNATHMIIWRPAP